ncbi:hypothetical protein [Streptomyces albogriseolus]|uniref:hypothetical protein n=1 Tax=Streptomyces albogriseolus TaxID=1887 RepID=UPI0037B80DD3
MTTDAEQGRPLVFALMAKWQRIVLDQDLVGWLLLAEAPTTVERSQTSVRTQRSATPKISAGHL